MHAAIREQQFAKDNQFPKLKTAYDFPPSEMIHGEEATKAHAKRYLFRVNGFTDHDFDHERILRDRSSMGPISISNSAENLMFQQGGQEESFHLCSQQRPNDHCSYRRRREWSSFDKKERRAIFRACLEQYPLYAALGLVNSRVIASTFILSTQASEVRVMWQSFLRTCFVCLADTMYFLQDATHKNDKASRKKYMAKLRNSGSPYL